MSRKEKFVINSIMGLVKQGITLVCGFIMTKAILVFYGSSVNGLISSITQFMGVVSFLELGVGPVIQSNLYKPLAEKNYVQVSKILKSSESFFHKIAYLLLIYVAVLSFIYPKIINSFFSSIYSSSLILIISISMFAQYYFGMSYQLILNADQKGYIQNTIQWVTLLINTIVCVLLMSLGISIHFVRLFTAVIYLIRPLILSLYVRKYYNIDKGVFLEKNLIRQKWNGFTQHLASVVLDNTDVVVLSCMSTLENVSVYMVYYSVAYGITQLFMMAMIGLEAMWGNMIANGEWKKLEHSFSVMEWLIHFMVTLIFTITALIITPFVIIYTKGVSDANYYQPLFGVILVLAFAMQCFRIPYFRIIKAIGHYKQTQMGALISMVLNILISVIFVGKFGLIGVAIGTVIAIFFHICFLAIYVSKQVFEKSILIFTKQFIVDALSIILSYLFLHSQTVLVNSYIEWIIMAVKISILVAMLSFAINLLFYKEYWIKIKKYVHEKIS